MTATTAPKATGVTARSAARLAVVQALYQLEMGGGPVSRALQEFIDHRLGAELEGDRYAPADIAFFTDVLTGAAARLEEIDALIAGHLQPGWSLDRLDRALRQILRAGAYELIARPDVPTAVIITEYVDVAHSFHEPQEAAFVNGLLDRAARTLGRPSRGA